jgi:hypothetical protein
LVESIAGTCLTSVLSVTSSSMPSFGLVKAAVLTFGTSCVSTPWPDGAGCSIVALLRAAAKECENDQETITSSAASVALKSCDTVAFPRVPALQVITRSAVSNLPTTSAKAVSAEAIAVSLESARNEIIRAEAVAVQAEEKKQEDKAEAESAKKAKRAKSTKSKQVSTTVASTDLPEESGPPEKANPDNNVASTIAETEVNDAVEMIDSDNESVAKPSNPPKKATDGARGDNDDAEEADDDDDDDDFPMIVDCGPDADDD